MKQQRSIQLLLLLVLALAAAPPFAQGTPEGDEEETTDSGFFVEMGTWIAQPTGVELEPVTVLDASNPFGTEPIRYGDHTRTELYYKLGYKMPKDYGSFRAWIYDFSSDPLTLAQSTPGIFQFGETMVNPLFAGVNLDGLADAFDSTASIGLSDFRFDYSHLVFENERVSTEWFVGWRRVKFNRAMTANYYALVPGFPALLPPLTDPLPALDPQVDSARISSGFEGRGLNVGLRFKIPLIGDRLRLETGFGYSALRGDMQAEYTSSTSYYVLPTTQGDVLLSAPYAAFTQIVITNPQTGATAPLATMVRQRRLRTGLQTSGRSSSAAVIDLNLELHWRAWKTVEFVFGFRQTRYDDVALDLRSKVGISPLGTSNVIVTTMTNSAGQPLRFSSPTLVFNTQDETETDRSVTFEGFYFGVGYTF